MAFVEHTVAVGEGVLDAVGVTGIVAVRVRVGVLDAVGVAGIVGVDVRVGVFDAVGVAGMVGVDVRVGVLDAVGVDGIVGVAVAHEPPTDRRTSSMNQPTCATELSVPSLNLILRLFWPISAFRFTDTCVYAAATPVQACRV
jgi:hypothetical protein